MEWFYGVNNFVPIDTWSVFEGNVIISLFSWTWEAINSLLIPTIKYLMI